MALSFTSLSQVYNHGHDTVIDVRSPSEFAHDHIPGAINLPVLSDAERAEVGTIYVQDSPFKARKVGAALVAANAARHIAGPLAAYDGSWKPMIYCWRGGQRSGSFAGILEQIGWRVSLVQGGYQTYRRLVQETLYKAELPHRFVLLDGNTGTAKTAILARLADHNVQSIDLEGLAHHRGSLLGSYAEGQPSQKAFESALARTLHQCDPERPIVLEAESSKVGQIVLPPVLWVKMRASPRIEITAPLTARVAHLRDAYSDITDNPDMIAKRLDPLRQHRGHAVVEGWLHLLREGRHDDLARALMVEHYDLSYAVSRRSKGHTTLASLHSDALDDAGQDALAAQIAGLVNQN